LSTYPITLSELLVVCLEALTSGPMALYLVLASKVQGMALALRVE